MCQVPGRFENGGYTLKIKIRKERSAKQNQRQEEGEYREGSDLSSTAPRQCAPRNCAPRTSRSANRAAQSPPHNSRRASRADTPRQFFHAQPVVPLLLTPRPCRVASFEEELRAPHRGTPLAPFVCGTQACSLSSLN